MYRTKEISMRKTVLATLFLTICAALAAQQAMNNDAVIKMVKAGLSDDIIVGSISSQPGQYDTSADGLIALKTAGASDKVVAAMISKASGAAAPAAAVAPAVSNGLPPGIDEIGVYIQDKSGNWVALMPEVVNFKTGGVLKSLATNGLVKGDINGHIEGVKAKTTTTLPVVFAVYTPDGTAITEYQLLRLRVNSDSREFRSMTGGVFHSSGGAKRDSVDFQATKLAPRLYQVTVDQSMGKGEYGLLPPGAVSSSNMASAGKIYTVSVPE
jgi:hypothetical protein